MLIGLAQLRTFACVPQQKLLAQAPNCLHMSQSTVLALVRMEQNAYTKLYL